MKSVCFSSSIVLLLLFVWSSNTIPVFGETQTATLESLRASHEAALQILDEPLRDFREKYKTSLAKLRDSKQESGDLEQMLLVTKEIEGLTEGKQEVSKEAFPELQRLQLIYANGVAEIESTKQEQSLTLIRSYLLKLDGLKVSLTKTKQIEEAVHVLEEMKKQEAAVETLLKLAGARTVDSDGNRDAGPEINRTASIERPFVNSLEMQFVPLEVFRGKPVLMSVWETRVADYEKFVKDTKRDWSKPEFLTRDDHPAVAIGWTDAVVFCDWLTNKERDERIIGPKEKYRLPSDYEWSCAVGIGQAHNEEEPFKKIEGIYPWGREWPIPLNAGNFRRDGSEVAPVAAQNIDQYDTAAPVGSFPPNEFGFFDLGGNAWEWCEDWISPEKKERRILRGGSWLDNGKDALLSSRRNSYPPTQGKPESYGFRCVLSSE